MNIIDELTYRSYRFNRINAPEIQPARWALVFSNVAAMEERFQAERHDWQLIEFFSVLNGQVVQTDKCRKCQLEKTRRALRGERLEPLPYGPCVTQEELEKE